MSTRRHPCRYGVGDPATPTRTVHTDIAGAGHRVPPRREQPATGEPRARRALPRLAAAIALFMLSHAGVACAEADCAPAIATSELANTTLPKHILRAIGVAESGRADRLTGHLDPWPWSVNIAGDSHIFETSGEAIAFVRDAQARGVRSIDVGCMQINLLYHPDAFASLEEAFTPEANVRYATTFLLDLRQRTGDWTTATGNYHSATPALSEAYARRVRTILTGELLDPGSALAPPWLVPAPHTSSALQIGTVTRLVPVFEPGAAPDRWPNLRSVANLPHVYHP